MKKFILTIFLGVTFGLSAQTEDLKEGDYYREDQLYIGLSYNALVQKPHLVTQNGLSYGLSFGYVRDIPLNKRGSLAFGIGLGYGYDSYNHNLKIAKVTNGVQFEIPSESYKRNNFYMHSVEAPIELRWRTSTATKYRFWRIYGGLKFVYHFATKSKFIDDTGTLKFKNIDEFRKLDCGLTLALGYGTWNFNVYYALNPMFRESAMLNNETVDMSVLKVGLVFYML